jgi:hypothetical protein
VRHRQQLADVERGRHASGEHEAVGHRSPRDGLADGTAEAVDQLVRVDTEVLHHAVLRAVGAHDDRHRRATHLLEDHRRPPVQFLRDG